MINYEDLLDCINDIDGSFDKIKNNPETIIALIKKTKDYTLYFKCDDGLKTDGDFLINVLKIFENDASICWKLIYYFLNKEQVLSEGFELLSYVVSSDIKFDSEDFFRLVNILLNMEKVIVNEVITYANDNSDDEIDFYRGFCFILKTKKNRPYSLKVLTDLYVNNFYEKSNLYFEIRKKFGSKQELNDYGINKFILEFMNEYDGYLADYVGVNIDYLDNIKNKVNKEVEKWEPFSNVVYNKCIDIVYDKTARLKINGFYLIYYFGFLLDKNLIIALKEMSAGAELDLFFGPIYNEVECKYKMALENNLSGDDFLRLLLPDLSLKEQKEIMLMKKELKSLINSNIGKRDKIFKFQPINV